MCSRIPFDDPIIGVARRDEAAFASDHPGHWYLHRRFYLTEALAAQGNAAEAPRVYNDLCATLREQLGVSPGASTRAVYDALIVA